MDALQRLAHSDAVRRLWARDASLFGDDPGVQAEVAPWLGWLGLGGAAEPLLDRISTLADGVAADGIRDVVLLGMGGSSLAPLVAGSVLPEPVGAARLAVLDTSSPAAVLDVMERIEPLETLFVVASKSGGTIEPNSLYAVFREWMDEVVGRDSAGAHFIATTDPGSSLETLARVDGFRDVIHGPADVGGRYSALTAFGLLPIALVGRDAVLLAQRAASMETACRAPVAENPGALLAAWIADGHAAGKDKLTIATSAGLETFGLWVEQLVAESTGKEGTGIVPVLSRGAELPTGFGDDRVVAVVRYATDERLADWAGAVAGDLPVIEAVLQDPYDLGGEFVRWEVATALVGQLLGINPFDQPSVTEAKEATNDLLAGSLQGPRYDVQVQGVRLAYGNLAAPGEPAELSEALAPLLASLDPRDYLALLVYVPSGPSLAPLATAADRLAHVSGNATVLQVGPRYLHSTGQLHKGGPNTGAYLVVTTGDQAEMPIPGRDFTLGDLYVAQALGDVVTLATHGRRVVAAQLPDASAESLAALARALERAL